MTEINLVINENLPGHRKWQFWKRNNLKVFIKLDEVKITQEAVGDYSVTTVEAKAKN